MPAALFLVRAWLAVKPIQRLRDARRARRGLPPTSEVQDVDALKGAFVSKTVWLGLMQLLASGFMSWSNGTLTLESAVPLVSGVLTIVARAVTDKSLAAKGAAMVLALFLFAPMARAATVTWTNPTQYDDGSALAPADIASTTIEWSTTLAFTAVAGNVVVLGSGTTSSAPLDPVGGGAQLCYRAKTTVVAAKGGGTSIPSNIACKTKAFPNPRPPTLLDAVIAWLRSIFGPWFA